MRQHGLGWVSQRLLPFGVIRRRSSKPIYFYAVVYVALKGILQVLHRADRVL